MRFLGLTQVAITFLVALIHFLARTQEGQTPLAPIIHLLVEVQVRVILLEAIIHLLVHFLDSQILLVVKILFLEEEQVIVIPQANQILLLALILERITLRVSKIHISAQILEIQTPQEALTLSLVSIQVLPIQKVSTILFTETSLAY